MKRAILIQPGTTGFIVELNISKLKSEAEYDLYAESVQGYIERVQLPCGYLIVNEEGLLRGMQPNPIASAIAQAHYHLPKFLGFYGDRMNLVGPVVLILRQKPAKDSPLLAAVNALLQRGQLEVL